jgi:hypothetical protein
MHMNMNMNAGQPAMYQPTPPGSNMVYWQQPANSIPQPSWSMHPYSIPYNMAPYPPQPVPATMQAFPPQSYPAAQSMPPVKPANENAPMCQEKKEELPITMTNAGPSAAPSVPKSQSKNRVPLKPKQGQKLKAKKVLLSSQARVQVEREKKQSQPKPFLASQSTKSFNIWQSSKAAPAGPTKKIDPERPSGRRVLANELELEAFSDALYPDEDLYRPELFMQPSQSVEEKQEEPAWVEEVHVPLPAESAPVTEEWYPMAYPSSIDAPVYHLPPPPQQSSYAAPPPQSRAMEYIPMDLGLANPHHPNHTHGDTYAHTRMRSLSHQETSRLLQQDPTLLRSLDPNILPAAGKKTAIDLRDSVASSLDFTETLYHDYLHTQRQRSTSEYAR